MWRISTIGNSSRSGRPASSRKSMDAPHRPGAASLLERESAAASAGRTPARRGGWSRSCSSPRASPCRRTERRQARHVDAADRSRGALQMRARCLQPRPPDLALAVGELELRDAADDRQHRPAHAQHDIAKRELRAGGRERFCRRPSAGRRQRSRAPEARISSASGRSAVSSVEIRAFSHASRSLMPSGTGRAYWNVCGR